MSAASPDQPPRQTPFRAWDAARTVRTEIKTDPQAWLIREYRIDHNNWNEPAGRSGGRKGDDKPPRQSARLRALAAAAAAVAVVAAERTVNDVLGIDVEQWQCLVCKQFGDAATCGEACHQAWLRGPARRLDECVEIKDTGTPMGYGGFVKPGCAIKAGEYIGEYMGELLPSEATLGGSYVYTIPGVSFVDAETYGNMTRFFNHSCGQNVEGTEEMVGGRRCIAFQALRDIEAGEEIFINYGAGYFRGHEMRCRCAARNGGLPHWPS
ncbi:hypothetical protein BJ170DRAFT_402942 [Xylariales sp. AK1849]|nr:hypothetical protein BJ170DRAFT_402942 [Xylariales sp. AK1849]